MRFNLLGAFEILTDDGLRHPLGTPKVNQVLALLLMSPGDIVSVHTLTRDLWDDAPPRSAMTTLQTYVYHARRLFEREGPGAGVGGSAGSAGAAGASVDAADRERSILRTQPPGYILGVAPADVDAQRFERLVKQSRPLLDAGLASDASARLGEALALWRGPVLDGTPRGTVLTAHISRLEELKLRAIEMRIESGEQLGLHREMVSELRELVATYPLNEWFHDRLISALVTSGQRKEAVHAYNHLRRTLSEELGLEPSPELRGFEREILGLAARERVPAQRGPASRA